MPAPPSPTPRYGSTPQWGLRDVPFRSEDEHAHGRIERYASNAQTLVAITAVFLVAAAAAELFRYGILLYNRTRLVSSATLATSDALVFFTQVGALVFGFGAVVAATCWLIRERRKAYRAAGVTDSRSVRSMMLLSILPIVRIVMPGVYVTELVRLRGGVDVYRTLTLVRIWWAVWAASNALILVQLLWTLRDSLQARADGVLLAALVALVAAASAILTLAVMRRIEGRTLRGSTMAQPTRWVISPTTPARETSATTPAREAAPTGTDSDAVMAQDEPAENTQEPDTQEPDTQKPDTHKPDTQEPESKESPDPKSESVS